MSKTLWNLFAVGYIAFVALAVWWHWPLIEFACEMIAVVIGPRGIAVVVCGLATALIMAVIDEYQNHKIWRSK